MLFQSFQCFSHINHPQTPPFFIAAPRKLHIFGSFGPLHISKNLKNQKYRLIPLFYAFLKNSQLLNQEDSSPEILRGVSTCPRDAAKKFPVSKNTLSMPHGHFSIADLVSRNFFFNVCLQASNFHLKPTLSGKISSKT